MGLIAYHLLESSICAYIEWLVTELMMTANKFEYKDTCLIMLRAAAITHKPNKPCISLESFNFLLSGKSCRVQSSIQGFIPPVAGDRRIYRADPFMWKPPGGLREDFFHATIVVFIDNPH